METTRKISDKIPHVTESLEARGLPPHSFFRVIFRDGSEADEHDVRWSEISSEKRVKYFQATKTVFMCDYPVHELCIHHDGLKVCLEVPEGCDAYQAIRSQASIDGGGFRNAIVGRCIGIVRNGEVLEEQFINGIERTVVGMKS